MPSGGDGRTLGWPMVALRMGLLALALVAVVMLSSVSQGEAFEFRNLMPVLLVQPLNMAALALIGWRLSVLSGGKVGVWRGIKASALSNTLLYVTPGRSSELIKPVYLAANSGLGLLQGLAVVAVERFLDILIVTLAGSAALVMMAGWTSTGALWLWGGVSALGLCGCAVLLRRPDLIGRVIAHLPGRKLRSAATTLADEMRSIVALRIMAVGMLIGLAAWLASFALVFATLRLSASVPLDPAAIFLVFLAGTIGLAVSVAPGGLGTFEAGVVFALTYHGVGTLEALNLALLMRLVNVGVMPLVALWAASADRLGLGELIQAARNLQSERAPP